MSRKKVRDSLLTVTVIYMVSLFLNYVWESIHEAFLYEVFNFRADQYILMVLKAAFVDASIILGIYLGVAVLYMDFLWLFSMGKNKLIISGTAGIIIAVIIEYRGAIVMKEWSYLPSMPTIFGIGLTPLIQLSTTGLLSFLLSKRLLYQKCAHS
jgi:hypothetical protein